MAELPVAARVVTARPRVRSRPAADTAVAAVAALAVLAVAAWLRLDQFAMQTLLDDEWHLVHQLVQSSPARFVRSLGHSDFSIPLALYAWLVAETVGLDEVALRLPALLAGLAGVVLMPWALRGTLDRRVLLVAAAVLAVSPLLVGYARMARPYALTVLLVYLALWALARAVADDDGRPRARLHRGAAAGYVAAAALAAWLHAITAPFVVAPLAALAWSSWRGRGPSRRELAWLVAAVALGLVAALGPPLLGDPAALGGKTGRDSVRWATLRGIWYIWLGTPSTAVVLAALALGALGAAPLWRASRVARWAVGGLALTLLAVLLSRPMWIFNPLTLARYLLPALPLWAMAIGAGVVRIADGAWAAWRDRTAVPGRRPATGAPLAVPLAAIAALGLLAWPSSPWPALLREPNSNTLSYYHQFDFRPRHNIVAATFDAAPVSAFWHDLARRPAGSVTVAVAPFRFESYDWLAPVWERASHQRVVPGFLSGGCGPWFMGEVPRQPRFRFRHAVHLADAQQLRQRRVDYVAWHKPSSVLDAAGVKRPAPECLAWLHARLGRPFFEDERLVVWRPGTAPEPPR